MSTDEQILRRVSQVGGICAVMEKMNQLEIPQLFDQHLGKRVKQARYSFSDAYLGWMYLNLCGAKRIEDIYTENLKDNFSDIPITKVCSPDSLGLIFKRFATPLRRSKNKDVENEINQNPVFNSLMLELAKKLGVLNETDSYMLDYDVTHIPTEKADARMTYKQHLGYAPAVSMIGKIPVNIECRNGNTSPAFEILRTLKDTYAMLEKHGIKANSIRMDAASYQKELIRWLDKNGKTFYIRQTNTNFNISEVKIGNWKKVWLHSRDEEITSVKLMPFPKGDMYRIVASRYIKDASKEDIRLWQQYQHRLAQLEKAIAENNAEEQIKIEEQLSNEEHLELFEVQDEKTSTKRLKKYIYRSIITNDYASDEMQVIKTYDMRGDSENNFRDLLNDFNWRRPPFRNMNENLVFMYVSAMAKIVFEFVTSQLSSMLPDLEKTRLKKFVAKFIRKVVAVWKKQDENWMFTLFNSSRRFDDLQSWAVRK